MKTGAKAAAGFFASSFERRELRRLLYLIVLILVALGEFYFRDSARRSFVYFSILDHKPVAEDRMVPRGATMEDDIRRYVEETLGGPVSLDLGPLISREASLESLLLRDRVVYVNFSPEGALPPLEGNQNLYQNLTILSEGIYRNFPYVKQNHFFIGGNEAFYGKFRSSGGTR